MHNEIKNHYQFCSIPGEQLDTEEYCSIPGKILFTTMPWLSFVQKDSGVEPVYIRIMSDHSFVGYFTGFVFKKFGIRIIGSPFNGWSTCHMGLDLLPGFDRCEVIRELVPFLYNELNCQYIEIIDRRISVEEAKAAGFRVNAMESLELDIAKDDDALFKQMKTDCRNFIRQFNRRGARIEIADQNDEFAEQYYHQLEDVFAKQGLVPTYSFEKVKCLINSLSASGSVLCLRVISPEDDKCIATSIFPGYGDTAYFWGGASYRADQHYRPNEYMIWTAIKYWREKGCTTMDMCGMRDYKRKFGPHEISYAQLVFAKNKLLIPMKRIAKSFYFTMIKVKGKLLHRQ